MSIRKNPEEAVPLLLVRLHKAKEHALQGATEEDEIALSSKFGDIQKKLESMRRVFPDIKRWEKTILDQFCALEQVLDDDIFKDPEKKSEVKEKLDFMLKGIGGMNESIPSADKLISKLHSLHAISFKPKDVMLPDDIDHHHQVCQEWVDLKIDNVVLASNVMSSFSAGFRCLSGSEQAKLCSLCLSVFPQNSIIEKKPLIYWWIGEGLVMKSPNRTAEEAGEQVFKELLDEGFIRPSSKNKSLGVSSFIIDPWIHRMLIWIAKNHQFLDFNTPQWTPCCGRRRPFLCQGNNDALMNGSSESDENFLMVFNVDEQYLRMKPERLTRLKRVEVMQMGRWQNSATHHIEVEDQALFDSLGSQKHLKYLSLRGISRIEKLPYSISELISLKILDLRACHNLEKLPSTISRLKNLTHLDVSQCYLLESMPKGVEQLVALQVLKGFVIGKTEKTSCKIKDLARLRNLRKLSIRVGNQGETQHDEQLGSLHTLQTLHILTIS